MQIQRRPFFYALSILGVFAFCAGASWGMPSTGNFENLGQQDGLPHRTVNDVVQDPRGFIWLATQNGLARFDGHEMKTFRHSAGDPDSISDDYIRALEVDSDGTLWVGTESGGLNRYDARYEAFETLHIRGTHQTADAPVNRLVATEQGYLWALLDSGISYLPTHDPVVRHIGLKIPAETVTEIILNRSHSDGGIWFIGEEAIFRVAPGMTEPLRMQDLPDDLGVVSAYDDGRGKLWLASPTELAVFDVTTRHWSRHVARFELSGAPIQSFLRAMFQDSRGRLWIPVQGCGVVAYDPASGMSVQYRHGDNGNRTLTSDHVLGMAEDHSGILWFATYDGVSKQDPSRQGMTLLHHRAAQPDSLSPGGVRAVEQDADGRLWVGHMGSGIDILDVASGKVTERLTTRSPAPKQLASDIVWSLHKDRRGRMWIGHELGLEYYDPERATVQRVQGLNNRVLAFAEDADGTLWIGASPGLYSWNETSRTPVPFSGPSQDNLGVKVFSLLADDRGHLWIGTDGDGLFRLHLASGRLKHFPTQRNGDVNYNLDIISDFHQRGESLWLTTLGGGLLRHHIGDESFSVPDATQPWPSNSLSSLLPAPDGSLWLPSHSGLIRYDPVSKALDTWGISDGLTPNGFTSKASSIAADGTLFLGSRDGLTIVRPESITTHPTAPRPVLTQLSILNTPVKTRRRDADSPLDQSIVSTETLTLRHDQFLFALHFSALHFANPAKNRYRYRLKGVDPDWIEADATQRYAQYSHISAGHYLFEVEAISRDGVRSTQPAQLRIRVLPPPWRTWWAYSLYALALAAGFVAFIQSQRRKVIRERKINRQLDELVKLRTEQVDILKGLLPICSGCKKVRDDEGYWSEVESYVEARSEAVFSHSMCPSCVKDFYPDLTLPDHLR